MNRESRRSFDDGPIAGLRIQEYWHSDVPPRGSEQEITFYTAEADSFDGFHDFAALALLFNWEDAITESARSTFTVDVTTSIDTEAFAKLWVDCAAKVKADHLTIPELEASFALSDEWNCRFYVAHGKNKFYAVCWSTSA